VLQERNRCRQAKGCQRSNPEPGGCHSALHSDCRADLFSGDHEVAPFPQLRYSEKPVAAMKQLCTVCCLFVVVDLFITSCCCFQIITIASSSVVAKVLVIIVSALSVKRKPGLNVRLILTPDTSSTPALSQ